jgi:hypothetical protein
MVDPFVDPRNCFWCNAELGEQIGQPCLDIHFKRSEKLENVVTFVKDH